MAHTQILSFSRQLLLDLSNQLNKINKFDEHDKKQQSIDACSEALSKLKAWLLQNIIEEEQDLLHVAKFRATLFQQIQLIAESSIDIFTFEDRFRKFIIGNEESLDHYTKELTRREKEVFHYVRKGLSYKAIGTHLCIAVSTVKKHIDKIYEKLNISNKYELVHLANTALTTNK